MYVFCQILPSVSVLPAVFPEKRACRNKKPVGTEDRMSAVISGIEHRINLQGALVDPRDVVRIGGGRSGDYYEKDDAFFDDSETVSRCHQLYFFNDFIFIHSLTTSESVFQFEQLGIEGIHPYHYESEADESEMDGDYFDEYDLYTDPSAFTFDNMASNDEPIDSSSIDGSPPSSPLDDGCSDQSHWVKPRAWRSHEPQLPDDIKTALAGLEVMLEPLGEIEIIRVMLTICDIR